MSSDVASVLRQLAIIQREIASPEQSGRTVIAYDNVPYTIAVANMPLFVNFAGPLTSSILIGSDDKGREFNEMRTYTMTLYHSAYGTGVEGEKSSLLTPYFELVYNLIGKYPHLKQLGGILDAKLSGDSGVTIVSFAGVNYFGIKFTLQVTGKARRVLGEDE